MSEILTESFCERCGTRYTFESALPQVRLKRVKVLSRGLKNFVMSDDTSMDEAMAAARSETDRNVTSSQLDAFHKTFNFCMSCRQYTCPNCWNDVEARCLSCAPMLGHEILPAPFTDLDAAGPFRTMTEPAPTNGTHWLNGANGANGTNGTHEADPAPIEAVETAEEPVRESVPEMIGLTEVAPVDIIDEINSSARLDTLMAEPGSTEAVAEPMVEATAVQSEAGVVAEAIVVAEPESEAEAVVVAAPEFVVEPEAAAEVMVVEPEPLDVADAVVEPEVLAVAEAPVEPEVLAVEPEIVPDAIAVEPEILATADAVVEPDVLALAVAPLEPEAPVHADDQAGSAARLAELTLAAAMVEADRADAEEAAAAATLHDKTAGQTSGWLQRFRPDHAYDGGPESAEAERLDTEPTLDLPVVAATAPETEPVVAEPVETEPAISEAVVAAAVVAEIAVAEAADAGPEPITAESAVETSAPTTDAPASEAVVQPAPVEAAPRQPVPIETVLTDVYVEPPAAEPLAAEPLAVETFAVETSAAEPEAAEPPVAAEPQAVEPQAVETFAVETSAVEPEAAEPPVAAEQQAAEPQAAEPVAAEPRAVEPPVAEDVVPQPVWRMVAPEPVEQAPAASPVDPTPSIPAAASAANPEPEWPTRPEWLGSAPASGLPFLGRPATPQGGLEALWAESNREVAATPAAAGKPAGGVQPCVSCGLSLSASARFCRRCGTLQGG